MNAKQRRKERRKNIIKINYLINKYDKPLEDILKEINKNIENDIGYIMDNNILEQKNINIISGDTVEETLENILKESNKIFSDTAQSYPDNYFKITRRR